MADVTALIPADAQALVHTDGMGSAAYLTADGRLCGFVLDREGPLPEVCGSADERALVLEDRNGNVHTLFGRLPEGAKEVAGMVASRTDPVMYGFLEGQGDPSVQPRIYALTPAGPVPEELRFSGDGVVLETVPLDLE